MSLRRIVLLGLALGVGSVFFLVGSATAEDRNVYMIRGDASVEELQIHSSPWVQVSCHPHPVEQPVRELVCSHGPETDVQVAGEVSVGDVTLSPTADLTSGRE